MEKANKFLITGIIMVIISGCVSVKLTDTWKSADFNRTKNEKILVVARAEDMDIRKSYEEEITAKLRSKGIDAVEAFKKFPALKEDKNRSQEAIDKIVKMFTDEGINGILLIALKDTRKREISETIPKVDLSTSAYGKYGISFAAYYNDVHAISYLDDFGPDRYPNKNALTYTSTTYILEVVLYNLSLEKEKQLTSINLIEATDPDSASEVRNKLTKIIARQFKN